MAIRIKVLPEDLVSKIAAGEVVERPASVVKELVENALDAGADEITIDVRGGGRTHIQVIDNGSGMNRDEALLAIERHATSKISESEDLFNIHTLGFRGEALAAISGVSKLELVTRTRDSAAATRVLVHGGAVQSVDKTGAPVGTSILVRNLFYNTPARLKFMKSAAVEMGHVVDLVTRLAMSRGGIAMRLVRGTETLMHASAVSKGIDRLVEILGPDQVEHLYPFGGERAGIRISGYLSSPESTRSGWTGLYAFVNQRFLRDRSVTKAVAEAYRGVIPKGRYPIAILFLEINPGEVDVNVHPGKIEVRFSRPRTVSELIIESMRSTLIKAPWRRSGAHIPSQRSEEAIADPGLETPQQVAAAELLLQDILNERRHEDEVQRFTQALKDYKPVQQPDPEEERARLESLRSLEPPDGGRPLRARQAAVVRGPQEPPATPGPDDAAGGLRAGHPLVTPKVGALRADGGRPDSEGQTASPPSAKSSGDMPPVVLEEEKPGPATKVGASDPASSRDGGRAFDSKEGDSIPFPKGGADAVAPGWAPDQEREPGTSEETAADLEGRNSLEPAKQLEPLSQSVELDTRSERPGVLPGLEARNFSCMRVIGQYANCFLLCQDADDLVIIDQHAAHERVTFERLRKAYEGIGALNQLLLTPQIVEIPRREAIVLSELVDDLRALGLEVEPFGGQTFAVKAMPVALLGEDPVSLLIDLAVDLSGDVARRPLDDRIYRVLATMACHGSVRANRRMTTPEMEALLKLLDGTDLNYACPHGRPLIVRSTRREIEKLFKRT